MSKSPIVEELLNYYNENNTLFCMPGHKKGKGFLRDALGERLLNHFIQSDITEVEPLDNLHNPEGIIKEGQELLAKYYGSFKSYFLVNGSTSGNLAMIFSAFNEMDKIIVERNCHRSISNAIILRKLQPIYIENSYIDELGTPLSIKEENFFELLEKHNDAKGILLTYPNYYGVCCNLEKIIEACHEKGMKVLVDSAHGAHLGTHKDLPKSAIRCGADMVVTSAHKTLPALTQGAYLHINNRSLLEKTDFYVSAFTTTSPSYLLMSSLDYSRYYLEEYGNEDYDKLLNLCKSYKKKINSLKEFHILEKEDIYPKAFDLDETRFVLTVAKALSGHKLLSYLRDNNIQGEMSDDRSVVLLFSTFNTEDEFKQLYNILETCNINELKSEFIAYNQYVNNNIDRILPYEAINLEGEYINYKDSYGRIALKAIVPYPPGVPLVVMGEKITKETICYIEDYLKNNRQVLGVKESMVYVAK